MKRFALSFFTIVSFIFYGLLHKEQNALPVNSLSSSSLNSGNQSASGGQKYKDGSYQGSIADAYYGNILVSAFIANGRITDIKFLEYPNDRQHSLMINSYAMPILKQEAISAQDFQVDVVSGATDSSYAFRESLKTALAQASIS